MSTNKSEKELAFLHDLYVAPDWGERFAELVDAHVKLPKEGRALYVAAGTGGHALALRERAGRDVTLIGVDESEERLTLARAKAEAVEGDGDGVPARAARSARVRGRAVRAGRGRRLDGRAGASAGDAGGDGARRRAGRHGRAGRRHRFELRRVLLRLLGGALEHGPPRTGGGRRVAHQRAADRLGPGGAGRARGARRRADVDADRGVRLRQRATSF